MNPVRLRGDRMNPVRTIERIIKAPDIHWVGTGFRDVSTSLMAMSHLCLIVCLHFCYSTIMSHIISRPVLLIQVTLHIPIKALKR